MKGKRVAELAEKRRLWQEHLSRWESSGLSQVEYCRQNNLRTNIFLYWKKKLLSKSSVPSLVEIPTAILPGSPGRRSHSFAWLLVDTIGLRSHRDLMSTLSTA